MKILNIKLHKYNSLALSNIKTIDIDVTTGMLLMLGANGSGKTSLLKELSPLPAIAANYSAGGYKEIEIEHLNSKYMLVSRVEKTAKHSFVKDNVELNEGGTGSVQKTLVEKHLNFTLLTSKLLINGFKFTSASTLARRDILTEVSALNLNYANSLHDVIKKSHRDSMGVLKHIIKKQEGVNTDLLTLGEINGTVEEADKLHSELTYLIPLSTNGTTNTSNKALAVEANLAAWSEYIGSYVRMYKGIRDNPYNSLNELIMDRDIKTSKISVLSDKIQQQLNTIEKLSKLTNVLENVDDGYENLNIKLADLTKELSTLNPVDGIKYNEPIGTVLGYIERLRNALHAIYVSKTNDMTVCNREEHNELKANLTASIEKEQLIKTGISKINTYIAHANAARDNSVKCPKCNILIGDNDLLSDEKLKEQLDRLEKGNKLLTVATRTVGIYRDKLELQVNYINYLKEYTAALNRYPTLLPIWLETESAVWRVNNHNAVMAMIEKEYNRLLIVDKYNTITASMADISKTIDLYKVAGESNAVKRKASAESMLPDLYADKKELEDSLIVISEIQLNYDSLTRTDKECDRWFNDLANSLHDYIEDMTYDEVGIEISSIQARLATIQGILTKKDNLESQLKDLANDYETVNKEQEHLAILMSELSPKDGLIAEQMTGFVNSYMSQVNSVISKIWEYNLEVGESGLEDKGLDYKFPLIVNANTVPEISMGSEGQKDVIDFAFTIVLMGYLGLQDFPIYLDELGSSFDYQHRSNLINYIKELLEGNYCSQMFMINHFHQTYGGFNNVDVLALSDTNIVLPDSYNDNVNIVKY